MGTLVIVACGGKKIWDKKPDAGPTSAKDAYISGYFKLNRKYAETFADRWVILSAKHGFIDPNYIIPENYDVTFTKPKTKPITIEELKRQAQEKQLDKYKTIIVLGGKTYAEKVRQAIPQAKTRIKAPLAGLPIGKQMQKIKQAIKTQTPLDP